jgi:hypothetical protein
LDEQPQLGELGMALFHGLSADVGNTSRVF